MNKLKLFSILLLNLFLIVKSGVAQSANAAFQPSQLEEISVFKAKLMARNGALMVDVREKDEVAELAYDVDGIINIPLSEFKARINELPKDKKLIMACRSGNRSLKAANILLENGYTNVVNMKGGMMMWQSKNLGVIQNGKPAVKKACCAHPNSKNCNPDGTCKKGAMKKCCSGKNKKCSKK